VIGLFYLGVFAVYIPLSIWLTRRAVKEARKRGIAGWKFGLAMALVMYHLVFWDWIPTVVAHKYYCATEAGFTVYKTLDEWKKENPGMMETLIANKRAPSVRKGDMKNYTDTYFLNSRINWKVKRNSKLLFNRWRHEQEVIDVKNNIVLARYVDFSTSQERPKAGWSGWKFWLRNRNCSDGGYNRDKLRDFRNNFAGEKK